MESDERRFSMDEIAKLFDVSAEDIQELQQSPFWIAKQQHQEDLAQFVAEVRKWLDSPKSN